MDKIWKKIGGLFVAAVMTITLTSKTKAESDEVTVPDNVPYAVVGSAAETSDAAGDTDVTGQEAAPEAEETDVTEEISDSAEDAAGEEEAEAEGEESESEEEGSETESGEEDAEAEEEGSEAGSGEEEAEAEETESGEEDAEAEAEGSEAGSEAEEAEAEETESEEEEAEAEESESGEEETETEEEETESGEEETETEEEEAEAEETEAEETEAEEEASEAEEAEAEAEETVAEKEASEAEEAEPAAENGAGAVMMLRSAAPADEPGEQWESLGEAEFNPDDPSSGEWESLGEAEFNPDDPSSGEWESLGEAEFNPDDPSSGEWESLGEAEFNPDAPDDDSAESEDVPDVAGPKELVLVGDKGKQDVTSDEDIVIKTAGLQHIGTLYSDGDVYIVGTGILLVDEVDLLYGKSIFLQPFEEIYGKNGGTAALFVLTGEKDGVKTYELINGSYADSEGTHLIPAILDEEYEIPAGISLVIPSGGNIVMQCVNMLVETATGANGKSSTTVTYSTTGTPERQLTGKEEGYSHRFIGSAPVLTISSGSRLEVQSGACIRLNHLPKPGIEQFINSPLINVNGDLALSGSIIGGTVQINSTGDVTGDGLFEGSDEVVINGRDVPVTQVNLKDGKLLFQEGGYVDSLNVTGYVEMKSRGNWTANSLTVNDGTLKSYDLEFRSAHTFTITKTVSGNGTIDFSAGDLLLAAGSASCSAAVVTGSHLSYAYSRDEGILRYNDETKTLEKAPLIPLTGAVSETNGRMRIPVADATLNDMELAGGLGSASYYTDLAAAVDPEGNPDVLSCSPKTKLTYSIVDRTLGQAAGNYTYIVETCVDGVYGYTVLSSRLHNTVIAAGVVQIVRCSEIRLSGVDGGSTVTNTDTSYTGSGVLGGSGAGSVNGGTMRLAVTGSRGAQGPTEDDPDPDDPKPDDPDPDDPKPDDPDDPGKQTNDEFRVWTENSTNSGCFELHIETKLKSVNRIAAPVKVRIAYTPAEGTEGKPLYVVFRNADGTLTAFAAYYDPVTGILSFSSDIAGEFVIVAFDFDGEPFTEAFYQALAELDEVKALKA